MTPRSIGAQIQEVERELALRERVYSRETSQKKQSENEEHMLRMRCVLETLQWLLKHETRIRAHLAPKVEPGTNMTEPG